MTDPHTPATALGTSEADIERRAALAYLRRLPEGQRFDNVQDVARASGIGTEQRRF